MLKYLRQLASESVVYGLSGVITRFITIFLVPLYTRVFTPADYGTMSLVRNSVVLLGVCASLALDNAAHRFYWDTADPNERKSTLACWAWCHLIVVSVATIAVIVFANDISTKLVGSTAAASSLRLAAGALPLNLFGILNMNRLRMQRRPWAVAIYMLVTSVVTVLVTAVFVLGLRRGVEGVFLAQFIVSFATAAVVLGWLREWINPAHFRLKRLTAMLRYALPLIPTLIAFWVVDVIDRYFLATYASTDQVGIYEIGYSIAAVVALGTAAFQQAWVPFAMSIQNTPEAKRVYAHTLVAYTWIGCIACGGAAVFAPEILRLLTTEAYYGAGSVVACLAFSYLLMGAGNIAALGAAMTKRTVSMAVALIASAVANIGLNFWWVPLYGKDGAAWATLVSSIFVPVYLFYRSQQFYPIPYRFGKPIAIIAFALAIIKISGSLSVEPIWLAVSGKMALLSLFFPLLLVLRIVTIADLRGMIQRAVGWSAGVPAAEA